MANDTQHFNPEIWYPEMQALLDKNLVGLKIANLQMSETIQYGDIVHKPYGSRVFVETRTKSTDMNAQDYNTTDESFNINNIKGCLIKLDKVDRRQSQYNLEREMARQLQYAMNKHIDSIILGEYAAANDDVYNDDIGGSGATTACAINAGNIHRLFTAAGKKLNALNVPDNERFFAMSPTVLEYLQIYAGGKDTVIGDSIMENGFIGRRFGFDLFLSNNMAYTARWTPANNPSDADTITIAGVVITFKTTLTGAAGEVLIAGTTALTIDNIVALLDDPLERTTTANSAGFSQANAAILDGIDGVDGTTYLEITWKGGGEVTVAASETNDPWSVQIVHCLAGRKQATDMCLQLYPDIIFNQEPKQPRGCGNYVADLLYGYKSFTQKAKELLDVNIAYTG